MQTLVWIAAVLFGLYALLNVVSAVVTWLCVAAICRERDYEDE